MENTTSNFSLLLDAVSSIHLDDSNRGRVFSGLISDEHTIDLFLLWAATRLVIVVPGLWANVLNVRTFIRMGLHDSVTISFFVMAVADFWTLAVGAFVIPLNVFIYLDGKKFVFLKVHPRVLSTMTIAFGGTFNSMAMYITFFLAVQRCLCITRPLTFRHMFSKRLTWAIMVFVLLASVASAGTHMASWKAKLVVNPVTNTSRYVPGTTPMYDYVKNIQVVITFMIRPAVLQVIIFGCVLFMRRELRASMEFRKKAAAHATGVEDARHRSEDKQDGAKSQPKERTAIVQVALICLIFLVTNLPKVAIPFLVKLMPGYQEGGRYANLGLLMANIRITFDYLNSALNFPVYYKYNTKFRKLCFDGVKKKK